MQEVLRWLINHCVEDTGDGHAAVAGLEAHPHKQPYGAPDKWFRGPTLAEAADHFGLSSSTIARWWELREGIFDGAVPAAAPAPVVVDGLAPEQIVGGPRLAPTEAASPQAVQPMGPPIHPLYRANFALGEVSREVVHMLQNQQNLYLENLTRAIEFSLTLINDLNEAYIVLLNPQSYPQYYPSAVAEGAPPPPAHHHHQQQHFYNSPPQHTSPILWHQAHVPTPSTHIPAPGFVSREDQGRYEATQADNHPFPAPLTPKHTPGQTQIYHFQQYAPQAGQQAGQHTFPIGSGSGRGEAGPQTFFPAPPAQQQQSPGPPPSAPASNAVASLSDRKRSYASKYGPGPTAGQPVELEDDAAEQGVRVKRHDTAERPGDEVVGTNDFEKPAAIDKASDDRIEPVVPRDPGTPRDENGRACSTLPDRIVPNMDSVNSDREHRARNAASPGSATERGSEASSDGSLLAGPVVSSTTAESGADKAATSARAPDDQAASREPEKATETRRQDVDMVNALSDNESYEVDEDSSPLSVEE